MSPLRWVQRLVRRRSLERESREELRFHVEMLIAELIRRGASEAEARRRARLELGDIEPVAEELAESRPGAALESLERDVRRAARSLRRAPGFALASVLLIALGVGKHDPVHPGGARASAAAALP